jgi:5-methylcytosine-specific restriction endonuclease McrA
MEQDGGLGSGIAPDRAHDVSAAEVTPAPAPATAASAPVRTEDYPRIAPLSAERFALQVTIPREVREKLTRAQELLGFTVPAGDVAAVLGLALDALIDQLERRKCASATAPRRARASRDPRYIPAAVKRAVRERDGDQCAFVSDSGRRCAERKGLEFDHVDPVARGGRATVSSVRLLCRAHNQLEADRVFGKAFMNGKRAWAAERRVGQDGTSVSARRQNAPLHGLGHHGPVG